MRSDEETDNVPESGESNDENYDSYGLHLFYGVGIWNRRRNLIRVARFRPLSAPGAGSKPETNDKGACRPVTGSTAPFPFRAFLFLEHLIGNDAQGLDLATADQH